MSYTRRQKWLWFLLNISITLSFVIIGFHLVARASGFRYNPAAKRWQKTGMIVITAEPKGATLILEDKEYRLNERLRVANLLPGNYSVSVNKPGYLPWYRQINIQPGFVINLEHIRLFRTELPSYPANDRQTKLWQNNIPDSALQLLANGEVWLDGNLVTRFAALPQSLDLLLDRDHLVYSLGNQIRVMTIDGQSDDLLYQIKNDQSTRLIVDPLTEQLIFADGETIMSLDIRA